VDRSRGVFGNCDARVVGRPVGYPHHYRESGPQTLAQVRTAWDGPEYLFRGGRSVESFALDRHRAGRSGVAHHDLVSERLAHPRGVHGDRRTCAHASGLRRGVPVIRAHAVRGHALAAQRRRSHAERRPAPRRGFGEPRRLKVRSTCGSSPTCSGTPPPGSPKTSTLSGRAGRGVPHGRVGGQQALELLPLGWCELLEARLVLVDPMLQAQQGPLTGQAHDGPHAGPDEYGGPWVARSITAATRWEARRARMIRALGCDTCGDGAIKVFTKQVLGSTRQGISIRPDTNTPPGMIAWRPWSDRARAPGPGHRAPRKAPTRPPARPGS